MPKRIYVGNLPPSATSSEVSTLFSRYGTVLSVSLNRGTAYVDMETGGANTAIRELNGTSLGGRPLNVNEVPYPSRS